MVVGDAVGNVTQLDVRTGRAVGAFKGSAGSVRSLAVHPTQNYLAACGLDRSARITSRELKVALENCAFLTLLRERPKHEFI